MYPTKQNHSLDMQLSILDRTGGYTPDRVSGRYVVGVGNLYTGHRHGLAYAIRHLAYSGESYGMWRDVDTVYVDRVHGTDNLVEALSLAKLNNELAIYDRIEREEIRIHEAVA